MATATDDRILTSSQVGELFGVDAKTVARWAASGKLPHFTTPGGHKRFRFSELKPHLATRGGEA